MALKRVIGGVACAVLLAACRIPENALDGPLAVPLRVTATVDAVEVDAPGWFADSTTVYLCAMEPPPLPPPGEARVGWSPGDGCHDYGAMASENGLRATLPLIAVADDLRVELASAGDWYVLLVKRDGDRAAAAIHSRFRAPSGFAG